MKMHITTTTEVSISLPFQLLTPTPPQRRALHTWPFETTRVSVTHAIQTADDKVLLGATPVLLVV